MKNNKINTLYLPKYAPELAKIYFNNGASITILKYIGFKTLPHELQRAIIQQNFSDTLKLIRKYNKSSAKNKKHVKINYTCKVFSTVSKQWHNISDTLAQGLYSNALEIKKIIDIKRQKNNNEYTKNLNFSYAFTMV